MPNRRVGTLVDFLLTRIAEDEEASLAGQHGKPDRIARECAAKRRIVALHSPVHVCTKDETGDDETAWDQRYGVACPTLAALAAIYADYSGCRSVPWSVRA